MKQSPLCQSVEALIFASGEPLSQTRVCEQLECTEKEAELAVEELNNALRERESALTVLSLDDCWQMTTRPPFAPSIRKMLEILRNTPLSTAAFEVLAVVAYNQPVTRSFVEQVRGVDCSGVMSSLVEKGLIEEQGRMELPGRPLIYGTTKQFLRCFGFSGLSDLPPLPKQDSETDDAFSTKTESVGADDERNGD